MLRLKQPLIMYTDTLGKQCAEKLAKSDGSIPYNKIYYQYFDPRKSTKTGNNNPKNWKHCLYCWSTFQLSKKHIGFAFRIFSLLIILKQRVTT